jgi:hypothetical protein
MFGTVFYLILFISVLIIFIGNFTKKPIFLLGIVLLIAYFPVYGILKLLNWLGSGNGYPAIANEFIYIFKFLLVHIKVISISSALILIFTLCMCPIVFSKIKIIKYYK